MSSCILNVTLAFWGQNRLEIYFIANVLAYLVITILYIYLNPRAKRALSTVGAVLLVGFISIMILEALKALVR